APNMRAALDDAVREFGEYTAEVMASPEVLGARDTTSLRLAGQYLHQAAGALLIVGLRGVDVYCQAAKRLLEAVDAGAVPADVQTLDVFSRAVQALQEYVVDLMAGMAEEPLRLFQPYQAVLARLGEERIHPADLWADELRHLPALLLPSRDLPGLARLRRKFELALLTALRTPGSTPEGTQADPAAAAAAYAPLEQLLHGIRAIEREPRRTGDDLQRDLWLVLALTFGALRAGLVPADMTAKRLAARVNLLLRQYSHNNIHLPQGLLTDALYLLAGMAYGNAPATPVGDDTLGPDIVACVEAFAIPPTHAPAGALHTRQYYALLPVDASDTLQRVGRTLETLSQQPEPAADELDAALQTLTLHAESLGQPVLSELSNRLAHAVGNPVAPVAPTLQFLSRMLARPWALHGESGDLRSTWFAARCAELAEHARATQDGNAVPAPAWLSLLAEEAAQRNIRAEQVRALQTLLASAETHLDAFEREGEQSGGLQEASRLFGEMQGAFAALDAYEAVHATEVAQSTIAALQAAGEGAGADRERYLAALAANVSGLQGLLDALSAGTELTGAQIDEIVIEGKLTPTERETAWREFAFDTESGMLTRREAPAETQADAHAADAVAASPLQSLLDRLLAKQPVDPSDPLAAELRAALQEARDAAAIDDDSARRRRLEEALAQFDAWQVGSAGALERMQAALAAPAAAQSAAAPGVAPAPAAARDTQSVDAELLDIFLSEAEEVLAGVRTDLHALQAAADAGSGGLAAGSDLDLLTQLRRAFHTLKGSGRMVGLMRYGEAAWAIEQVMNVWLAESRVPTHDLVALLTRAESELSTWAAAIAQSPQTDHPIEPLIAAAERVRHGGPFVWLETVPEAHDAAATSEPVALVEAVEPANDASSLVWEDEPAIAGLEAPSVEFETPNAELHAPHAELETPSTGFEVPTAESETSDAEFETPVGEFQTPHAEFDAPAHTVDADAKVIPFPFGQTG
ncbi:MAG TPA: Hpt domain-containing protein, partial [Albitalea sp.]|nr:Hpt domain-containing protein [Albitalea sp.]